MELLSVIRGLALLPAVAFLAACAGGPSAEPDAALTPTPTQQAWEQRIVQAPWLVSADYFRQRAPQKPAMDAPETSRSREELQSRQKMLEERVARLEAGAPPPAGYVVSVSGRRIYTDLTAREAGVKIGATLSILAERELVHPASGRRLGHALEEIGRATVIQVAEQFSLAEIVEVRAGEAVKPKDRVAVRP